MKKKILALFAIMLIIMPCLFFAACGKNDPTVTGVKVVINSKTFTGTQEDRTLTIDYGDTLTNVVVKLMYSDNTEQGVNMSELTVTDEHDILSKNIIPVGEYVLSFKYGDFDAVSVTVKVVPSTIEKPTEKTTNFVYDGTDKTYLPEGFDDRLMSISGNIQTNAGEYTAVVTLKNEDYASWKDNTKTAVEFKWTINKKAIDVPEKSGKTYTYSGSELSVELLNIDRTVMSVTGDESAVNAGKYSVYVELTDKANYCWNSGADTTRDITINWEILKRELLVPTKVNKTYTYTGSEQTLELHNFVENAMAIENGKQTNAGSYSAVITLKDTINNKWTTGVETVEIEWTIEKAISPEPATQPDNVIGTYDANKTLADYSGQLLSAYSWVDPTEVPVCTKREYNAYYNADPANYEACQVKVIVELSKATPVAPAHAEINVEYKENLTLADVANRLAAGFKFANLSEAITYGKTEYDAIYNPDKNNYLDVNTTVTVVLTKTDIDFAITSDISKAFDAEPVTAPQTNYTGTNTVTVKYYENDGETELAAAPSDAGLYKVKVTVAGDDNHNATTVTADFYIKYDLSDSEKVIYAIGHEDLVYDGAPKTPAVEYIKVRIDNKTYDVSADNFNVAYENNTDYLVTSYIIITGKNLAMNTIRGEFTINLPTIIENVKVNNKDVEIFGSYVSLATYSCDMTADNFVLTFDVKQAYQNSNVRYLIRAQDKAGNVIVSTRYIENNTITLPKETAKFSISAIKGTRYNQIFAVEMKLNSDNLSSYMSFLVPYYIVEPIDINTNLNTVIVKENYDGDLAELIANYVNDVNGRGFCSVITGYSFVSVVCNSNNTVATFTFADTVTSKTHVINADIIDAREETCNVEYIELSDNINGTTEYLTLDENNTITVRNFSYMGNYFEIKFNSNVCKIELLNIRIEDMNTVMTIEDSCYFYLSQEATNDGVYTIRAYYKRVDGQVDKDTYKDFKLDITFDKTPLAVITYNEKDYTLSQQLTGEIKYAMGENGPSMFYVYVGALTENVLECHFKIATQFELYDENKVKLADYENVVLAVHTDANGDKYSMLYIIAEGMEIPFFVYYREEVNKITITFGENVTKTLDVPASKEDIVEGESYGDFVGSISKDDPSSEEGTAKLVLNLTYAELGLDENATSVTISAVEFITNLALMIPDDSENPTILYMGNTITEPVEIAISDGVIGMMLLNPAATSMEEAMQSAITVMIMFS